MQRSDDQRYSSKEKNVNILNDQISVFNVLDDTDMLDLVPLPYNVMPTTDTYINGVAKLLRGFKSNKLQSTIMSQTDY